MRSILFLLFFSPALHATCVGNENYGTYCRLFHESSPWNLVPLNPVLATGFVIPKSNYYPQIAPGPYSTGVFEALPSDPAVTVFGKTTKGLWDPDAENYRPNITIPRWPASAVAATGSDGHCDIVDAASGRVHSFWQLKRDGSGRWTATQYAWSKLNGRGFGDPAHYFQGARAAGVPSSGGVVRKHEVDDGEPMFYHALAMSLTYNALSKSPNHIFPATSGDRNVDTNTGIIPEGARIMLPQAFNAEALRTEKLRKIARTLKVFGGIVVDRNYGTPFVIYVENGAKYNLHEGGWNNTAAQEMQKIRENLRMVDSVSGYRSGAANIPNSESFRGAPVGYWVYNSIEHTTLPMNLLSMRRVGKPGFGTINIGTSSARGVFNTWIQGLVFPPSKGVVQQSYTSQKLSEVSWAKMYTNVRYLLSVTAVGGAQMILTVGTKNGSSCVPALNTGWLGSSRRVTLVWPPNPCNIKISAQKPAYSTAQPAWVAPTLVRIW